MNLLSCIGDLASILTFLGAVLAYIWYRKDACKKSKRLEMYLRDEKRKGDDKGQRSFLNIVRYVGLTEAEIIQASFRNPHIARRLGTDPGTGLANVLLFEYEEGTVRK